MSWKKYYDISYYNEIVGANCDSGRHTEVTKQVYQIVYNDNCANPGHLAYKRNYRTKRLAIRGAERLYRRTYGDFEDAFLSE